MAQSRSMEARVGRVKQRYAPDGSRLVAGVVAVSFDKRRILVVESTRRQNHWVLPKGGFETDEARPEDAATREAWEEAGVIGRVTRSLGNIEDSRLAIETTSTKKGHARTLYQFFEFEVEKEEAMWPEMHKRKRRWLTYEEAVRCFKLMNRPELKEAVDRSSVLK